MTRPRRVEVVVTEADAGRRLDQVLGARVPGLSRRAARAAIDIGAVFLDGRRVKIASRALRAGERVSVVMGGALERASKEVGGAARARDDARLPAYAIVHEDADVIVVDKPAGLLVAPTPEGDRGTLADLLSRRGGGGGGEVFVVHRIDLMTSGLLVLAKSQHANQALSAAFRVHDVEREYLAVLAGAFPGDRRTLTAEVGGRRAVTHFAVDERLGERATVVRARLETGRTHQIRIHAAGVGHPVLGDRRYGRATSGDPPRMALHAARLGFSHPATGERVSFTSELPADLADWLAALRA